MVVREVSSPPKFDKRGPTGLPHVAPTVDPYTAPSVGVAGSASLLVSSSFSLVLPAVVPSFVPSGWIRLTLCLPLRCPLARRGRLALPPGSRLQEVFPLHRLELAPRYQRAGIRRRQLQTPSLCRPGQPPAPLVSGTRCPSSGRVAPSTGSPGRRRCSTARALALPRLSARGCCGSTTKL